MHAIRHFYPCDEPIMMQVERRRTGSKSSPLDGLHPIYDDDSDAAAACATSHSSMSTDKQDRSDCDSLESLAGFTMPPCEDERSEITTKMHNLSYKPRATVNSHNRYHNIGTHRLSSSCNSKPSSFGGVEAPTPLRNPGTALRKSSLCMESSSHTRGVPTPCSTVSMKRAADITHISTAEDVELSTNSDDLSVDALCASTGSTSTNRSAAVVDVEHGGMTMKESGTSTEETYQSGQATGTGNDRPKATLASSCSSFSRLLFLLGSILSLWVAIDNHTFTKELHASSNETPPTDVEAMDKSNRKRRMRLLDQSFGEDSPARKRKSLYCTISARITQPWMSSPLPQITQVHGPYRRITPVTRQLAILLWGALQKMHCSNYWAATLMEILPARAHPRMYLCSNRTRSPENLLLSKA